jgi:hypothetical protein
MTTKIEHFQPKNFIRLEWDGNELTCFGRRGNGEEEPWNAHEFDKGTPTRKFFETLEKTLKSANVGSFTAPINRKKNHD